MFLSSSWYIIFLYTCFDYNIVIAVASTNADSTGSIHWRRLSRIYVANLTTIGSDNGLSPGIMLTGYLGIHFSDILTQTHLFSFKKMYLIMTSGTWRLFCLRLNVLTNWVRVMHICVSKLTSTGLDNGLSPGRRQTIIWLYAGILLIRTLGTNASDILSEIHTFSLKKIRLNMSSAKSCSFRLGLKVLKKNLVHDP